jgi:hypothetical protein
MEVRVARFVLVQNTKTGKNIPKDNKIYQMATKMPTGRKVGRPNGHRKYQCLPMQDLPRFTQIGSFGLKIYHLATLIYMKRQILMLCRVTSKLEAILSM